MCLCITFIERNSRKNAKIEWKVNLSEFANIFSAQRNVINCLLCPQTTCNSFELAKVTRNNFLKNFVELTIQFAFNASRTSGKAQIHLVVWFIHLTKWQRVFASVCIIWSKWVLIATMTSHLVVAERRKQHLSVAAAVYMWSTRSNVHVIRIRCGVFSKRKINILIKCNNIFMAANDARERNENVYFMNSFFNLLSTLRCRAEEPAMRNDYSVRGAVNCTNTRPQTRYCFSC